MNTLSRLPRTTLRALMALSLATGLAVAPSPGRADTLASEPVVRRTIHVPRDKSLSFRLPSPASRIVITQPEIAKVTATGDQTFYVQGMELGATNMLVYGRGGQLAEVIDVRVGFDAEGLQQDLSMAFPGEPMKVRNLGETLMLSGEVSDTGVQRAVERIAEKYAPDSVVSRLTVRNSQQVILEVRILEASRNSLKDIGINLRVFNDSFAVATGTGLIGALTPPHGVVSTRGGWNAASIDTALQALEEKGLVRTLAKPNLVAISGQKASFLAGGEFPYPVPQDLDKITIEFRQYGVKLNFLPIVKDNGWIQLAVEPEVSELDYANALTLRDITVPALSVRRASTTLELRPGDTFAMAGIFQRTYRNSVQQTPGLGNIPVLGALFRSAQWKRGETELVIIVTPRLSTPADRAIEPIDSLAVTEPSTADLLLRGRTTGKPATSPPTPATR